MLELSSSSGSGSAATALFLLLFGSAPAGPASGPGSTTGRAVIGLTAGALQPRRRLFSSRSSALFPSTPGALRRRRRRTPLLSGFGGFGTTTTMLSLLTNPLRQRTTTQPIVVDSSSHILAEVLHRPVLTSRFCFGSERLGRFPGPGSSLFSVFLRRRLSERTEGLSDLLLVHSRLPKLLHRRRQLEHRQDLSAPILSLIGLRHSGHQQHQT